MGIFDDIGEVAEQLALTAQDVDQALTPPRSQLEMLASAGYFSYVSKALPPVRRRLLDILSAGCGTTAFLASQHEAACRRFLKCGHPLFESAAQGQVWVGVCFAHLRRHPSPVSVQLRNEELVFDGVGPWFSGLGLMERVLVAGATAEGEFLMGLSAVQESGIVVGESPRLAVMNATATVPLSFHGLRVPRQDLIVRTNAVEMGVADMHSTVFQSARSLGVARASARYLPPSSSQRLLARIEEHHKRMDAWDSNPGWSTATLLRRDALELAGLAVQSALVCAGGQAHNLSHPVQRLAREASFYATTQLTSELREAFLARLES